MAKGKKDDTKVLKLGTSLIIEPHPKDYKGYPFITLLMYRKQHMLAIIDNTNDQTVEAFILDLCAAEGINEERLIVVAAEWYEKSRDIYPLSIEFSKLGLTHETSKIYRSLNTEHITRVIGPVPNFPMNTVRSVKRRRRKAVPAGVEVTTKSNVLKLNQFL